MGLFVPLVLVQPLVVRRSSLTPGQKGSLGEIAVVKELVQQGYAVYLPFGNNTRVDMIAESPCGALIRVQVKATVSLPNGSAMVKLFKQTLDPKYNYHYAKTDFDVLAAYIMDWDEVAFIHSDELYRDKDKRGGVTFRRSAALNNQSKGINLLSDYRRFPFPFDSPQRLL